MADVVAVVGPADGPALRIALLTYSTRPRGGVVHTLALAENLAQAGHRVSVWTLARGGDAGFFRSVSPDVRVHAVPFPDVEGEDVGQRVLRSIRVLGAAFGSAPDVYDVVHAQDCISANAVPGRIRTVHHLDHFSTPELAACHERAIVEPCAHICVSGSVAAELAAGWGVRAAVIPNGVDAARFEAAAADRVAIAGWRRRFGSFVLAVGGIEPRKGTVDLIRAMAVVRRIRPGTALVIAGGETLFDYRDYRHSVDELATRLEVEPVVLGPVDHDTLPGLVAAAGVFAFPSVQEGFGLAAMEALAAGVPVVVRDLPVLREVFEGAVRFATDPASLAAALLAALDQAAAPRAEQAPPWLAAGRQLARRHRWQSAAAAHVALYRRLIAAGRPVGTESAAGPASDR